jgi:hypothetical protein
MAEATSSDKPVMVDKDCVEQTIKTFTDLDESGDKRSMNKMARRLGKEQPALLQFAAKLRDEHGEKAGEAAVFYGTLVWAIFDRHQGKCPRLTSDNLGDARKVVDEARAEIDGLADRPLLEQVAPELADRQPHIYEKVRELLDEDIVEEAITAEVAELIYPPTQVIVEAFDAAIEGRRPGERLGPIVRDQPKVGRNEPCPCGSGKKFKKCCGRS